MAQLNNLEFMRNLTCLDYELAIVSECEEITRVSVMKENMTLVGIVVELIIG